MSKHRSIRQFIRYHRRRFIILIVLFALVASSLFFLRNEKEINREYFSEIKDTTLEDITEQYTLTTKREFNIDLASYDNVNTYYGQLKKGGKKGYMTTGREGEMIPYASMEKDEGFVYFSKEHVSENSGQYVGKETLFPYSKVGKFVQKEVGEEKGKRSVAYLDHLKEYPIIHVQITPEFLASYLSMREGDYKLILNDLNPYANQIKETPLHIYYSSDRIRVIEYSITLGTHSLTFRDEYQYKVPFNEQNLNNVSLELEALFKENGKDFVTPLAATGKEIYAEFRKTKVTFEKGIGRQFNLETGKEVLTTLPKGYLEGKIQNPVFQSLLDRIENDYSYTDTGVTYAIYVEKGDHIRKLNEYSAHILKENNISYVDGSVAFSIFSVNQYPGKDNKLAYNVYYKIFYTDLKTKVPCSFVMYEDDEDSLSLEEQKEQKLEEKEKKE